MVLGDGLFLSLKLAGFSLDSVAMVMQIFTALRLANCPGRDQEAFPPICDCDLEIRSRSKILFSNGSPGQNIWAHKILLRYAENSVSEVNPRLEKKNGNSGYLNPSNHLR